MWPQLGTDTNANDRGIERRLWGRRNRADPDVACRAGLTESDSTAQTSSVRFLGVPDEPQREDSAHDGCDERLGPPGSSPGEGQERHAEAWERGLGRVAHRGQTTREASARAIEGIKPSDPSLVGRAGLDNEREGRINEDAIEGRDLPRPPVREANRPRTPSTLQSRDQRDPQGMAARSVWSRLADPPRGIRG